MRATFSAAWRSLRRRPLPPSDDFTVGRTGQSGQLVAAVLVLTAFEAPAVHLILRARLGPGHGLLQLGLAALHAWALVWIVGDRRLIREAGHRLGQDALELRLGARWRAQVPYRRVHAVAVGASPRDEDIARLTPLDAPNVRLTLRGPVELRGPLGLRRSTTRLALFLDEPRRFVAALERRLGEAPATPAPRPSPR